MTRTVDGRAVQIIDPGRLNTDAGPDFFNAKIAIDGRVWAGDVEIHVRASDWHRHGHDTDPAYKSVILHVVDRDDTAVSRPNGEIIPQMRMACAPDFSRHYCELVDRADRSLPCEDTLRSLEKIYLTDWLDSLAFERIYAKADHIGSLLERLNGDWESVCYVAVARSLGFGINGDPFERLALSTPLRSLARHRDSLFTLEALLFGQSGLLDSGRFRGDDYVERLRKEYAFIAGKFGLRKVESPGWKMARMRPPNFPHRRVATLAAMLHQGIHILSRVLEVRDMEDAMRIFTPELTGYWMSHYSFGVPSAPSPSALSRSSVAGLVINAVVPLQTAYGLSHGDRSMTDRAVELLESLPAEHNSIVELFRRAGLKITNAFLSQGVIQMRRAYCENRKCLYCRVGHRMLAAKAPR